MSSINVSKLPKDVQLVIASFLPGQDLAELAKVSKVFQNVVNNPLLWQKVANQLNIKITDVKNPKKDVEAYYEKTNAAALRTFGGNIQITSDVFEQNQIIERYIEQNKIDLITSFFQAVKDGQLGLVRMFMQAKVPILSLCTLAAARNGHKAILELLLNANAPIHNDCVHAAVRDGRTDIVDLLLKVHAPFDNMSFEEAASEGKKGIVELLLKVKLPDDGNCVFYAAQKGHADILEMLINAGAPLPTENFMVNRILQFSIREQNVDIIRILLKAGAQPSEADLELARAEGTPEIVQLLQGA